MFSYGMVGYITIILLLVGAVFLMATRITGKIFNLVITAGIILFTLYVLRMNGVI